MITLTAAQVEDLGQLQYLCKELKAELVIIGAIAYQHNFPNEARHTSDIDTVVALDLDDFAELEKRLQAGGWSRRSNQEHRWRSARGTLVDLIPAGPKLREAKKVVWPGSQFEMSLVGFDHVFSEAQVVELTDRLSSKIVPPAVLMLLKIVAYLDDPTRREKDLSDIRSMLALYETESDRVFSDAVLDANLGDVSLASAFLLGADLRRLCTLDELVEVHRFLALVGDGAKPPWSAFVRAAPSYSRGGEDPTRAELAAFAKGLNREWFRRNDEQEEPRQTSRQASVFELSQSLAKTGAIVRVGPLTPPLPRNEFKVLSIDTEKDVLVTRKLGSDEPVYLPLSQIEAVLHAGSGTPDLIQLKGRLQWMTLAKGWEVRPEKPDSSWGIAKRPGDRDLRISEIQRQLRAKGYSVGWANEDRVNFDHGADREIVYDADGYYFRKRDRPFDQFLVRSPKRQ